MDDGGGFVFPVTGGAYYIAVCCYIYYSHVTLLNGMALMVFATFWGQLLRKVVYIAHSLLHK